MRPPARRPRPATVLACLLLAAPAVVAAERPGDEIVSFRLANGFTGVVAVRPGVELAAVNLTVAVGAADDPAGSSGMAHLLEHVSLSGTAREGSLDPLREAAALERLDAAQAALARRRAEVGLDLAALGDVERRVAEAEAAARRWAEPGDVYGTRLEARGAIGLNATTASDTTEFFCRLPVGEVGYWIDLEADRVRRPMLRNFYSERQVVLEEIAGAGGGATAQGRFLEQVFGDRPSGRSVFGKPAEVRTIGRPAARAFLAAHYRPERMVLSVVGDVRPEEIRRLSERAFGDWRPAPAAAAEPAAEDGAVPPPASGSRVATFNGLEAPIVLVGFPRPPQPHPDAAALAVLAELLNAEDLAPRWGRLSEERRLAWSVGATDGLPESRRPSLFAIYLYGNPGVAHRFLLRYATDLVGRLPALADEEIEGAIRRRRVRLARRLADPDRLASLLASSQAVYGDWRLPLSRLRTLAGLEPAAVRQVAARYLQLDGAEASAAAGGEASAGSGRPR